MAFGNREAKLPQSYVDYIGKAKAEREARQEAEKQAKAKELEAEAEAKRQEEIANAFRLLDLPQELQNIVLRHHYPATNTMRLGYCEINYSHRYQGRRKPPVLEMELPYDPLLTVNKQLNQSAKKSRLRIL